MADFRRNRGKGPKQVFHADFPLLQLADFHGRRLYHPLFQDTGLPSGAGQLLRAWKFIPFLVMATVFNCFGTFTGSVYTVEKKSILSFLTISAGAVLNIVLNLLLIPLWGVNGAAFSTFVSYLLVFILRFLTSRRFIRIRIPFIRFTLNTLILGAQSLIMIFEVPGWIAFEVILTAVLFAINIKELIQTALKLLKRA